MDNDNKVTIDLDEEKKSDVLLFLQEELIPLRQKKRALTYDLEKEYAKTKKNKNIYVWITLSLTVVLVIFSSWFVINKITKSSNQVDVTLEAFEDLNLRNLFDALSKTQDLYEKASKNKAELQAALDMRLNQALKTRDTDLEYTRKLGLSKKNRQAREKRIYTNYSNSVKAAHEEYDEKIAAADLELKQYEEQLKSFDSANVEKAQEWEKQMDSERQVHEIEKNKLTQEFEAQIEALKLQMNENQERSYNEKRTAVNDVTNHYKTKISKLDPVIRDLNINSILQNSTAVIGLDTFDPTLYTNNVTFSDPDFIKELESVKRKYEDFVKINNYAETIPFTNGMTKLLASEQNLIYDMLSGLASTGTSVINSVKAENKQLAIENEKVKSELNDLRSALNNSAIIIDAYSKEMNVDGFILANATNGIVVQFSSAAKSEVKNDGSTRVKIYNNEKKVVGKGAIWFKQNIYYLSLDSQEMQVSPGYSVKFTK